MRLSIYPSVPLQLSDFVQAITRELFIGERWYFTRENIYIAVKPSDSLFQTSQKLTELDFVKNDENYESLMQT